MSRVPKPWEPFDPDHFIAILMLRHDGDTTEEENEYIKREMRRNPKANYYYEYYLDWCEEVKTQPLYIVDISQSEETVRPSRKKLALPIAASILLAYVGFSLSMKYKLVRRESDESSFHVQMPLYQIADSIRQHYGEKVLFDQEEIKYYHFTYTLDSTKQLIDFLDQIYSCSDLRFYRDGEGNLHFEKKPLKNIRK
ncbi:hypothetical protein GCM10009415_17960 [Chitinophaga japonensis]